MNKERGEEASGKFHCEHREGRALRHWTHTKLGLCLGQCPALPVVMLEGKPHEPGAVRTAQIEIQRLVRKAGLAEIA